MTTPTGFEADGPPVRYTEGRPDANIAHTTFTPPADKVTKLTSAPSNPLNPAPAQTDGSVFAPIAAPTSATTSAPKGGLA